MKKFIAAAAISFAAFSSSANAMSMAEASGLELEGFQTFMQLAEQLQPAKAAFILDSFKEVAIQASILVDAEDVSDFTSSINSATTGAQFVEVLEDTDVAEELTMPGGSHPVLSHVYNIYSDLISPEVALQIVKGSVGSSGMSWTPEDGVFWTEVTQTHVDNFIAANGL